VIQEAGFKTKLDTNGTQPEILDFLVTEQLVDHVAMDVKAPLDDAAYSRCAGVFVPVEIMEKSIHVLLKGEVPATFRCTVAPTLLTEEDIYRLATELKEMSTNSVPSLVLQNFNPADPMDPALQEVKPFEYETLAQMQAEVDRILSDEY
jgi:pyruvate formate lyase activating enzyme